MCNRILIYSLEIEQLQVKKPGLEMATEQSELDLSYGMRYQNVKIPEAYERLILDTYVSSFLLFYCICTSLYKEIPTFHFMLDAACLRLI
jgi:hypothetical protein